MHKISWNSLGTSRCELGGAPGGALRGARCLQQARDCHVQQLEGGGRRASATPAPPHRERAPCTFLHRRAQPTHALGQLPGGPFRNVQCNAHFLAPRPRRSRLSGEPLPPRLCCLSVSLRPTVRQSRLLQSVGRWPPLGNRGVDERAALLKLDRGPGLAHPPPPARLCPLPLQSSRHRVPPGRASPAQQDETRMPWPDPSTGSLPTPGR